MTLTLRQRAEQLEAFETDPWAAKAILDVELLTKAVIEPSAGTGVLAHAAREAGYVVWTMDIFDWSMAMEFVTPPNHVGDWLNRFEALSAPIQRITNGKWTALMNPPFQTACEFVDRAFELGAYKVVCFQRWAWRESAERDEWWQKNPPARIWLCRDRASCWRFDIPKECPEPGTCPNRPAKKREAPEFQCRYCMSSSPTAHAWFIWERGHKGAEVINVLRKNNNGGTAWRG